MRLPEMGTTVLTMTDLEEMMMAAAAAASDNNSTSTIPLDSTAAATSNHHQHQHHLHTDVDFHQLFSSISPATNNPPPPPPPPPPPATFSSSSASQPLRSRKRSNNMDKSSSFADDHFESTATATATTMEIDPNTNTSLLDLPDDFFELVSPQVDSSNTNNNNNATDMRSSSSASSDPLPPDTSTTSSLQFPAQPASTNPPQVQTLRSTLSVISDIEQDSLLNEVLPGSFTSSSSSSSSAAIIESEKSSPILPSPIHSPVRLTALDTLSTASDKPPESTNPQIQPNQPDALTFKAESDITLKTPTLPTSALKAPNSRQRKTKERNVSAMLEEAIGALTQRKQQEDRVREDEERQRKGALGGYEAELRRVIDGTIAQGLAVESAPGSGSGALLIASSNNITATTATTNANSATTTATTPTKTFHPPPEGPPSRFVSPVKPAPKRKLIAAMDDPDPCIFAAYKSSAVAQYFDPTTSPSWYDDLAHVPPETVTTVYLSPAPAPAESQSQVSEDSDGKNSDTLKAAGIVPVMDPMLFKSVPPPDVLSWNPTGVSAADTAKDLGKIIDSMSVWVSPTKSIKSEGDNDVFATPPSKRKRQNTGSNLASPLLGPSGSGGEDVEQQPHSPPPSHMYLFTSPVTGRPRRGRRGLGSYLIATPEGGRPMVLNGSSEAIRAHRGGAFLEYMVKREGQGEAGSSSSNANNSNSNNSASSYTALDLLALAASSGDEPASTASSSSPARVPGVPLAARKYRNSPGRGRGVSSPARGSRRGRGGLGRGGGGIGRGGAGSGMFSTTSLVHQFAAVADDDIEVHQEKPSGGPPKTNGAESPLHALLEAASSFASMDNDESASNRGGHDGQSLDALTVDGGHETDSDDTVDFEVDDKPEGNLSTAQKVGSLLESAAERSPSRFRKRRTYDDEVVTLETSESPPRTRPRRI